MYSIEVVRMTGDATHYTIHTCTIQTKKIISEDKDANTICTVSDFAAYGVFLHGAKGAGTAARLEGTITRPEQTRQRKRRRAYDGGNAKAALSQPTARPQQGLTRCSMRVKPHLNFPPPYPHIWLQHRHCRALLTVTKRKQQKLPARMLKEKATNVNAVALLWVRSP
jgi:hypothetical protein